MNTVRSKEVGSVQTRTGMNPRVDLLGATIPEQKRKKEKRFGYLGRKELIAEVREIFPNATVLPNEHNE
jgi:hypothetical protein